MRFLHTIAPIMWKEFLHVWRDARTLAVLFLVPTGLMLLVGFVVNFDVKHIRLAVFDQDGSERSRALIATFTTSEYFDYTFTVHAEGELDRMLDDGHAAAAVIIPARFGADLDHGHAVAVQVLIDGSNATLAPTVTAYIGGAVGAYSSAVQTTFLRRMGRHAVVPVDFRPRVWYNPDLSTVRYLIPGLIGYVLMLTAVIATAMSIVREQERGTMEQLIVSSVRPLELIAGKLLPYLLIALGATGVLLVASVFVFDVVVKGSLFWLFVSVLIFLTCALALGLWVSTVSRTQQVAFTIATLVSTLPSMLLSGFIYPIRSMPVALQVATNLSPAKFFIHAIRAVMLKGVGPEVIWGDWLAMLAFTAATALLSARQLRKQTV